MQPSLVCIYTCLWLFTSPIATYCDKEKQSISPNKARSLHVLIRLSISKSLKTCSYTMKGKSPSLLKKIMAALSNKGNELRVRIMIFFLLHKNMNRSSLTNSFSPNIQALVTHPRRHPKKYDQEEGEERNATHHELIYYNKVDVDETQTGIYEDNMDVEAEYQYSQDLTGVLFEESKAAMEEEEVTKEVVDEHGSGFNEMVKYVGEVREENVDQAADLFIRRFRREIQLQRLQSLEIKA